MTHRRPLDGATAPLQDDGDAREAGGRAGALGEDPSRGYRAPSRPIRGDASSFVSPRSGQAGEPSDARSETLGSTGALAAEAAEFDRNAVCVRGSITLSFDATSIVFFAEVDNGVGVGGAVGYRLHPRIALEGRFEWQGDQSISVFSVQDVVTIGRWDAAANAQLFVATGRWQPYLVAGLGYVRATGVCGTVVNCSGGGSFVLRTARLRAREARHPSGPEPHAPSHVPEPARDDSGFI